MSHGLGYRRMCQHCGVVFVGSRKERKYCSRRCAGTCMPHEVLSANGRKGAAVSAARRKAQQIARLKTVWPWMPEAALPEVLAMRRAAWLAGYKAGRKPQGERA